MGAWRKGNMAMAAGAVVAATVANAAPAVKLVAVTMAGTQLSVGLSDGRTLSGVGLVGAVLGLRSEEGAAMRVKIEAVTADPQDRTGGGFLYRFTAPDATGQRQPVCGADPGGRQLGIPP